MHKILEVIVTSLYEAVEAERGGADRLELVRALDDDGLTPSIDLVRNIVRTVSIPVRVMVREDATMSAGSPSDVAKLQAHATALVQLPIDGLVLGFLKDGEIDFEALHQILSAVSQIRVTFHRAFELTHHPAGALTQLKLIPQIDRLLTGGGSGTWPQRKARLLEWQELAQPGIKILTGGSLTAASLAQLSQEPALTEFHIGRAARIPPEPSGTVRRTRVAELRKLLP